MSPAALATGTAIYGIVMGLMGFVIGRLTARGTHVHKSRYHWRRSHLVHASVSQLANYRNRRKADTH